MSESPSDWPEVGDLIVATVVRIVGHGAYVTLDEYDNKEGLLHISEISSSWVRNIRNHVRERQKVVLNVRRVDPSRKQIDLSLGLPVLLPLLQLLPLVVLGDPQEIADIWDSSEEEAVDLRTAAEEGEPLPPEYPLITFSTPSSRSNTASVHQKHPAPKVAILVISMDSIFIVKDSRKIKLAKITINPAFCIFSI